MKLLQVWQPEMMGYDLEREKCSQNSILFITSWEMESLRAASSINFVRFGFNIIFSVYLDR